MAENKAKNSIRDDWRVKGLEKGIKVVGKSLPTKSKSRRILKKAKQATVVVQVAARPRKEIKNFFANNVEQERRNLFFN